MYTHRRYISLNPIVQFKITYTQIELTFIDRLLIIFDNNYVCSLHMYTHRRYISLNPIVQWNRIYSIQLDRFIIAKSVDNRYGIIIICVHTICTRTGGIQSQPHCLVEDNVHIQIDLSLIDRLLIILNDNYNFTLHMTDSILVLTSLSS